MIVTRSTIKIRWIDGSADLFTDPLFILMRTGSDGKIRSISERPLRGDSPTDKTVAYVYIHILSVSVCA